MRYLQLRQEKDQAVYRWQRGDDYQQLIKGAIARIDNGLNENSENLILLSSRATVYVIWWETGIRCAIGNPRVHSPDCQRPALTQSRQDAKHRKEVESCRTEWHRQKRQGLRPRERPFPAISI